MAPSGIDDAYLGNAPLYVVEAGLKGDEEAFNRSASQHTLTDFDYEVHSILNEEGYYVIRTWSKQLHPSKLDFAMQEDMERATKVFVEHMAKVQHAAGCCQGEERCCRQTSI